MVTIFDLIKSGKISLESAKSHLLEQSKKHGDDFVEVAKGVQCGITMTAYQNKSFLAQVFQEENAVRISINRVELNESGERWKDGITWDEIQKIKGQLGFGDLCAIEIYPPEKHLVDVANIRHIWILPDLPEVMWRNGDFTVKLQEESQYETPCEG